MLPSLYHCCEQTFQNMTRTGFPAEYRIHHKATEEYTCLSSNSVLDTYDLQRWARASTKTHNFLCPSQTLPDKVFNGCSEYGSQNPAITVSPMSGDTPEPSRLQVNSHQLSCTHRSLDE